MIKSRTGTDKRVNRTPLSARSRYEESLQRCFFFFLSPGMQNNDTSSIHSGKLELSSSMARDNINIRAGSGHILSSPLTMSNGTS